MAGKPKAQDTLTHKQEAFALAYVETGNAAEAYRRAYDVDPSKQANSWIYVEACQLLDNPKVSLRVKQLQEEAEKLSLYSVSKAYQEYEAARALAEQVKNPSAFVAAVKGKVALFGLEAPARKHVDHTSSDGTMTPQGIPDDVRSALDAIAGKISGSGSEG